MADKVFELAKNQRRRNLSCSNPCASRNVNRQTRKPLLLLRLLRHRAGLEQSHLFLFAGQIFPPSNLFDLAAMSPECFQFVFSVRRRGSSRASSLISQRTRVSPSWPQKDNDFSVENLLARPEPEMSARAPALRRACALGKQARHPARRERRRKYQAERRARAVGSQDATVR